MTKETNKVHRDVCKAIDLSCLLLQSDKAWTSVTAIVLLQCVFIDIRNTPIKGMANKKIIIM